MIYIEKPGEVTGISPSAFNPCEFKLYSGTAQRCKPSLSSGIPEIEGRAFTKKQR